MNKCSSPTKFSFSAIVIKTPSYLTLTILIRTAHVAINTLPHQKFCYPCHFSFILVTALLCDKPSFPPKHSLLKDSKALSTRFLGSSWYYTSRWWILQYTGRSLYDTSSLLWEVMQLCCQALNTTLNVRALQMRCTSQVQEKCLSTSCSAVNLKFMKFTAPGRDSDSFRMYLVSLMPNSNKF